MNLNFEERLEIFDISVVRSEKLGDAVADSNAFLHPTYRYLSLIITLGLYPKIRGFSDIILIFEGDSMANHPSALKRYRQSQRRRLVNQMNRHKLKTQIKKLRAAIAAGKGEDAKPLLPATLSIIDQSVQK